MVKDHSDSERGNPLLPHGLLFSISSMGSPTDRITRTTSFVTLAGTRNSLWLTTTQITREEALTCHFKGCFLNMHPPTYRTVYTLALICMCVKHWTKRRKKRYNSFGPPRGIDPMTHRTMIRHSITELLYLPDAI